MYGVPTDLPLELFVGHSIELIRIGTMFVRLDFDIGNVRLLNLWELRGPDGSVVDAERDDTQDRDCYRIHQLLQVPVVGAELDPPRSATLVFATGHRLTLFDDDGGEAFIVEIDGAPPLWVV